MDQLLGSLEGQRGEARLFVYWAKTKEIPNQRWNSSAIGRNSSSAAKTQEKEYLRHSGHRRFKERLKQTIIN
jgi:hypothetical protein